MTLCRRTQLPGGDQMTIHLRPKRGSLYVVDNYILVAAGRRIMVGGFSEITLHTRIDTVNADSTSYTGLRLRRRRAKIGDGFT